jgi:hypothetical protein
VTTGSPWPGSHGPPWAHAQLAELRRARNSVSVHAASRGAEGGDRCSSEPTGVQSRGGAWGILGGQVGVPAETGQWSDCELVPSDRGWAGWGGGGTAAGDTFTGEPKSGGPIRCAITCSAQPVTPLVATYCHTPSSPSLLSHIPPLTPVSTGSRCWRARHKCV